MRGAIAPALIRVRASLIRQLSKILKAIALVAWKAPSEPATSAPIKTAPSHGHRLRRDLQIWAATAEADLGVADSEVVAAVAGDKSQRTFGISKALGQHVPGLCV